DRQRPETVDLSCLGGNAYGVTGRNGVNTFIRSAVWASAEQQESTDVLFIQLRDSRFFDKRLQTARPQDSARLHAIIKRTHAREVAGQDGGSAGMITKDHTPIADQLDKTVRPPALVCGARQRCVAGIALQRVRQQQKQIAAIVEPSIPVENLGLFIALVQAT